MNRLFLVLLFCLAWPVGAKASTRPVKLGQCVACHGEDGRSRVLGTPHLAGQDETYLARALAAYRAGSRSAAPMNSVAGTLNPSDIAALAAWYANQPGFPTP